jgi:hypothetical protein
MDVPGSLVFAWAESEQTSFSEFPPLPTDAPRLSAEAYFNSAASAFGAEGALVWAGFELPGPRYGILLLDLDLSRVAFNGAVPVPSAAISARYLEKEGDTVTFQGEAVIGSVKVLDLFFYEQSEGAVEGTFELVFVDPAGVFPGSRILAGGDFMTDPSPGELRDLYSVPVTTPGEDTYVSTGCDGDLYVGDDASDGCDCGGEASTDDSGCEGDSSSGSGCEGDSSASSGCEGDSGGGGCEGDTGGSGGCSGGGGDSCEQRAHAATVRSPVRAGPMAFLERFFPLFCVLAAITWLRKRR